MEHDPIIQVLRQSPESVEAANAFWQVLMASFKVQAPASYYGYCDIHAHGTCVLSEDMLFMVLDPALTSDLRVLGISLLSVDPRTLHLRQSPLLGDATLSFRAKLNSALLGSDDILVAFSIKADLGDIEMTMDLLREMDARGLVGPRARSPQEAGDRRTELPSTGSALGPSEDSIWTYDASQLFQLVDGFLVAEEEPQPRDIEVYHSLRRASSMALVDPDAPQVIHICRRPP